MCLNFVVVSENGGKMPVLFQNFEFEYERHFSFSECSEVKYCYLADIFQLSSFIFSIGDFLIIFSISIEIMFLIKIYIIKEKIKKIVLR